MVELEKRGLPVAPIVMEGFTGLFQTQHQLMGLDMLAPVRFKHPFGQMDPKNVGEEVGRRLPEFVAALAPEWASLPTREGRSYYGQPVKSYSELQKTYQQGLQPLSTDQAQGESKGQDLSSSGLFQGFMSALLGAQQKQPTTKDLLNQELMGQLIRPPSASINPFQLLLNNPYG